MKYEAMPLIKEAELMQGSESTVRRESPENDVLIRVENLQKRYGSFQAVAGVHFDVRRGEIFGLLGPNRGGEDDHDGND